MSNLILFITFVSLFKLMEIKKISDEDKIYNLLVLKDTKNKYHVVLSTQAGIKSLNINGELEWYKPGSFCPLRYELADHYQLENILGFKKYDKFYRIYIISLNDGSIVDSTELNLKELPQGIQYVIVSGKYFIIEAWYEGKKIKREHFVLIYKNKKIKIRKIEFSPVPLYGTVIDGLPILNCSTPLNLAQSQSGLSDYYPGVVIISPKTRKIMTRYVFPLPGYYNSRFYKHPEKNAILFPLSPSQFTYWLDFTYVIILKIPELKEIKKIPFDFKSITSNWIKLDTEYVFILTSFKQNELYVINDKLKIIKKMKYGDKAILKTSKKFRTTRWVKILEGDINHDKKKDVIIIDFSSRMSYDPKSGVLLDREGYKDISGTFYIFLNPFKSQPIKVKEFKGILPSFLYYIEENNLFFVGKYDEIKIYKLKWEV